MKTIVVEITVEGDGENEKQTITMPLYSTADQMTIPRELLATTIDQHARNILSQLDEATHELAENTSIDARDKVNHILQKKSWYKRAFDTLKQRVLEDI